MAPFAIDPVWKTQLLNGWDEIDLTLAELETDDRDVVGTFQAGGGDCLEKSDRHFIAAANDPGRSGRELEKVARGRGPARERVEPRQADDVRLLDPCGRCGGEEPAIALRFVVVRRDAGNVGEAPMSQFKEVPGLRHGASFVVDQHRGNVGTIEFRANADDRDARVEDGASVDDGNVSSEDYDAVDTTRKHQIDEPARLFTRAIETFEMIVYPWAASSACRGH